MTNKERIEKEAEVYIFNHIHDVFGLSRQECYIAGYERAQQELQAYRDIIKELLPMAEKTFDSIARHEVIYAPNKLYKEEVAEIIDKARKLIE